MRFCKCIANFECLPYNLRILCPFTPPHPLRIPADEGSRFKLTDFIQRCKQINGTDPPHWWAMAGPRPLGCSEQTSKTYFNYLQGSLSGFLRLNCQRFSVSSCPDTGTPAGNVCQGKYKNGYLVKIFCFKCTNLKSLLTWHLQREIVTKSLYFALNSYKRQERDLEWGSFLSLPCSASVRRPVLSPDHTDPVCCSTMTGRDRGASHWVISAGKMSSTLNLEPPVPPVPRRSRSRSKEVRPVSGISQISNKSGVEIIQRCSFPVSFNRSINTLLFSEIIKIFVLWIR